MNQPTRPSRPRPAHAPNGTGNGGARQGQGGQPAARRSAQKPEKPVRQPTMVGQAAKFVFMPEIGRSFESVKFAWHLLVNLVAQIYAGVGLIAKDHPCLDLRNASQYKLFDIIRIAYKSLKWEKESIPQIVIFGAVLAFLFFIALSLATFILNIGVHTAHAAAPTSSDQINGILDRIFNVKSGSALPTALGGMLSAYSNLVLILAGIILIWTIITYVMESARQGQAGGKSFNHSWAPMRLVFALGLLVPLSSGLNSGQYIILYLAKWGSDVASNVYNKFTDTIGMGQGITSSKFANPIKKEEALKNLFNLYACAYATNIREPGAINLPSAKDFVLDDGPNGDHIHELRFNRISGKNIGNVDGCGRIRFYYNASVAGSGAKPDELILNRQFVYFSQNKDKIENLAKEFISRFDPQSQDYFKEIQTGAMKDEMQKYVNEYNADIQTYSEQIVTQANENLAKEMKENVNSFGWIMAPAYYYRLGELNARIAQAQESVPEVINNGSNVFDYVTGENNASPTNASPNPSNNGQASFDIFHISSFNFQDQIASFMKTTFGPIMAGNFLATLLKDFVSNNPNPMLALISFGNILIFLATSAWSAWVIFAAFAGMAFTPGVTFIEAATPMLQTLAMLLFTTGATLAIVLPLLPTVRFLFAVLGWVILVLVAVMGMPLFALAHLKTGGEGWVGQLQVASAYNMITGIILRPTLIIIGFVVGLMLFNNIVRVLAMIYIAGVGDIGGNALTGSGLAGLAGMAVAWNPVGAIGAIISHIAMEIFKLFMMSVLFQGIANSCFKLVDIIPSQAMTWMGTGPMQNPVEDGAETFSRESQGIASKVGELQSAAHKGISDYRTKKELATQGRFDKASASSVDAPEGSKPKLPPPDQSASAVDITKSGGPGGANPTDITKGGAAGHVLSADAMESPEDTSPSAGSDDADGSRGSSSSGGGGSKPVDPPKTGGGGSAADTLEPSAPPESKSSKSTPNAVQPPADPGKVQSTAQPDEKNKPSGDAKQSAQSPNAAEKKQSFGQKLISGYYSPRQALQRSFERDTKKRLEKNPDYLNELNRLNVLSRASGGLSFNPYQQADQDPGAKPAVDQSQLNDLTGNLPEQKSSTNDGGEAIDYSKIQPIRTHSDPAYYEKRDGKQ